MRIIFNTFVDNNVVIMTFWEILDSNLFQTVAVLVGAGVAWSVYLFGKRRMVKNIARILVLQIRNIEEAISYLKS